MCVFKKDDLPNNKGAPMGTFYLKVVIVTDLLLIVPTIKQAIKVNQGKIVGMEAKPDPVSIKRNIQKNKANLLIITVGEKHSICKTISEIRKEYPLIRVVLIATTLNAHITIKTEDIEAITSINQSIDELIQAIYCVKHGRKYYSKIIQVTCPITQKLTYRERQIFDLLNLDFSKKEISEILGISIKTVRTHTRNINQKMGTSY